MTGKIYLIPSPMGEQDEKRLFPAYNIAVIQEVNHYIVENVRTARRFIKKVFPEKDIENTIFNELNKHNPAENIEQMIQPVFDGFDIGIISEAGMPCIADPGSLVVEYAHKKNVQVIPLVGPNSIIMALISSGFNGQNFVFHGYLPIKEGRKPFVLQMEQNAQRLKQTQIFMETPYRNQQLFSELLTWLRPATRLCIATDVTLPTEKIRTYPISEWKKKTVELQKRPSIFLIM